MCFLPLWPAHVVGGTDWAPIRLLLQLIQPTDLKPSQVLNPWPCLCSGRCTPLPPPSCPTSPYSSPQQFCGTFCALGSIPPPASCLPTSLPGLIPSIIHSTKWIFNLSNEMTLPTGWGGREGVGKAGARAR